LKEVIKNVQKSLEGLAQSKQEVALALASAQQSPISVNTQSVTIPKASNLMTLMAPNLNLTWKEIEIDMSKLIRSSN
jgi:hypothetical protein